MARSGWHLTGDVSEPSEIAERRARLAEVERELGRVRYRHDIAMSAFRFEEATALGRALAELEKDQQALAAALPTAQTAVAPTGVLPVLAGLRRRRRRMG